MPQRLDRRLILAALASFPAMAAAKEADTALSPLFRALEARLGGRFGACILDTHSTTVHAHRAHMLFPMCSTFKALAAAMVLAQDDRGVLKPGKSVSISKADILPHSPVCAKRIGAAMTLGELCHATITTSDNAAANLILKELGGPAALTAFLRGLGDTATRLDRWEQELNEATPGDPRDTSSPAALVALLNRLLLEQALSPASRAQLADWLKANTTGDAKVRAGLPKDWIVGDKTGAGGHGTNNDIGILYPPGRKPILFALMITQSQASMDDKNAAMAEVARALHKDISG